MRPAITDFVPYIQRFDDMGNDFIYPYTKWFYEPAFAQKQILIEASKNPMQLVNASINTVNIVEKLAKGFHRVVLQMRARYDNRPSFIEINDEYDVQDLFYAMLLPFFSDIRREEQAPSFAGSPSRIDFLLKNEQVAIEIKKTRRNLKSRQLGEELIIDITRYRTHPDFKTFIVVVYDPDRYITHPEGIENDLNGTSEGANVKVFIIQS